MTKYQRFVSNGRTANRTFVSSKRLAFHTHNQWHAHGIIEKAPSLHGWLFRPCDAKTASINPQEGSIPMKRLMKVLLVSGFTSAAALTAALGQTGPLFSFDELGHMTINGAVGPPGVLGFETNSGMTTLCYHLPFAGGFGDVLIFEGTTSQTNSDLIRFNGQGLMYFFSDRDVNTNDVSLADVGLPLPITPSSAIFETGVEGANFSMWTPGEAPPGPGFDPSRPTYKFISDVVPEPGTATLACLGGGLLLLLTSRRRDRRH